MAFTINYNGTNYSLWSSSSKITTPSLIIDGSKYVPLASGKINDWVDIQGNGFQYQLSPLLVDGSKRAPYARRFVKNISGTLSGNITGTATTTGTTSHTVTGVVPFGYAGTTNKGASVNVSGDGVWNYGVVFNFIPFITANAVMTSATCMDSVTAYVNRPNNAATFFLVYGIVGADSSYKTGDSVRYSVSGNVHFSATGYITTTVGTSESKSITVSKTDSYGVTYPSTPSILNLSGASIQSQGTSSTTVSAVLTGTVNNGQTLTLTRAYSYTVLGAI